MVNLTETAVGKVSPEHQQHIAVLYRPVVRGGARSLAGLHRLAPNPYWTRRTQPRIVLPVKPCPCDRTVIVALAHRKTATA